jgi:hypothetical protein
MLRLHPEAVHTAGEVAIEDNVEATDVLADLAKEFPREVAYFLQTTVSLGCLVSLLPIICSISVAYNWASCGCCNRPLMAWIFIHCLLHVVQLPMRVLFLRDLHFANVHDTDISECVRRVTTGLAWRVNRVISILAYGWLVLGMVWILHAGSCQLAWICMLLVGVTVAKFLMTWILFRYLVPQPEELPPEVEELDAQQQGASWELIDSLPIVTYLPEDDEDAQDTCVVCLSGFECGQSLRKLPCGHKFHQGCIDTWLSRRKVCPLCLLDVEAVPQWSPLPLCEKKGA